jgi:uncharacterized OB-fold protein
MTIQAEYLGMPLGISDLDTENRDYFAHCARHEFHLQRCLSCELVRYPPAPSCPWCAAPEAEWVPVEGRGTVYSYTEVHHAIQGALKPHTPYLVLLVELDTQCGRPSPDEALRVIGNLTNPDGTPAPPETVAQVGIGTRVRMVFAEASPEIALPQWTIDGTAGANPPWRHDHG